MHTTVETSFIFKFFTAGIGCYCSCSPRYLEEHPEKVHSLHQKVKYFRDQLKKAGIITIEGDSAIIPIMIYDTAKAIRIAARMLEEGVYVVGFGYPVVPEGQARIRIQVSDALTYDDIDYSIGVLKRVLCEQS